MQETLWWRSISGPLAWEHGVIKLTSTWRGPLRATGAPGAGWGGGLVLRGQLVQPLQFRLFLSPTTRNRRGIFYQFGDENALNLNPTIVDDADTLDLFLGQHDWLLAAPMECKPEAAEKKTAVQDEASAADICLWPWNKSGPGWSQQTCWLLRLTVSETNTP